MSAPPEAVYAALLDPDMHARTAPGREKVVALSPSPCGSSWRGRVCRKDERKEWADEVDWRSSSGGWGERRILKLGDEVTFEATHFGIRQRLTARITAVDPPHSFEDTQVRGFFRSLVHRHEFHAEGEGTRMIDVMEFASPLGQLFDKFVLGPYLSRFLTKRGHSLALMLGQLVQ